MSWYGGSWERGRKEQFRFVGAALAQAGQVELRTYSGRGHTDTVAAFAKPAPRKLPMLIDIRDVIAATSGS